MEAKGISTKIGENCVPEARCRKNEPETAVLYKNALKRLVFTKSFVYLQHRI